MTDSADDKAVSIQSAVCNEVCISQVHKDKDDTCTMNTTGDQVRAKATTYSAHNDKRDTDLFVASSKLENITVETVIGNIKVETVEVLGVGVKNNNDIHAGITEKDVRNIQTEKQVTRGDSLSEAPGKAAQVNDGVSLLDGGEIIGSNADTAQGVSNQEHLTEAVLDPASGDKTVSGEMSHVQENCASGLLDKTGQLNQSMDTSEKNNAPVCSGVAIPCGITKKGSPGNVSSDICQGKSDKLYEIEKNNPKVIDKDNTSSSECDNDKQGCEESDDDDLIIVDEKTISSESDRNQDNITAQDGNMVDVMETEQQNENVTQLRIDKLDLDSSTGDSENDLAGSSCAPSNEEENQSESGITNTVSKRGDNIFTNLANICVGKIYVEDDGSNPGMNDLPSISEMLSEIATPEKRDQFRVSLERLPTEIVRRGSIDVQSCRIPSPRKTPKQDQFSPSKLNIKKELRPTAKGTSSYKELKPLSIKLVRTDDPDLEMIKCEKKLVISMTECHPGMSPVKVAKKTEPSTSSLRPRLSDNSSLLKKIGRIPEDEMSQKWLKPFEKDLATDQEFIQCSQI